MGRHDTSGSSQYVLPFDAAQDELLAFCRLLRGVPLGLSRGRHEGVVQLLERLIVVSTDLRELSIDRHITTAGGQPARLCLDRAIVVRAAVIRLSAGISGRSPKSERTLQRWRRDAQALGLIHVDYRSLGFGRSEWAEFYVDLDRLHELLRGGRTSNTAASLPTEAFDCHATRDNQTQHATRDGSLTRHSTNANSQPLSDTRQPAGRPSRSHHATRDAHPAPEGRQGVTRGDKMSGPRGDKMSGPRGDKMSGPFPSLTPSHSPPPLADDTRGPQTDSVDTRPGAVVCVFGRLGVGMAATLVAEALARGCSPRELLAIARWFERSQRRHRHRWDKPSTVLMLRLKDAQPGLPAWAGWIPGRPPPVRASGVLAAAKRAKAEAVPNDQWQDMAGELRRRIALAGTRPK